MNQLWTIDLLVRNSLLESLIQLLMCSSYASDARPECLIWIMYEKENNGKP